MNNIRKVIVTVYTNRCGEDNHFAAIICDECMEEFENFCQMKSYENFCEFGGFEQMMIDEFGEPDEEEGWTEEQLNEGYDLEGSYYGYEYDLYDEHINVGWEWYDLEYDCTSK